MLPSCRSPLSATAVAALLVGTLPAGCVENPAQGPPLEGSGSTIAVDQHGVTPTALVCEGPDDAGGLVVPETMVTALLAAGTSGYPTVSLTRQTVDALPLPGVCADLVVATRAERALIVAGHSPCHTDADCPAGTTCVAQSQTCQSALSGRRAHRTSRCHRRRDGRAGMPIRIEGHTDESTVGSWRGDPLIKEARAMDLVAWSHPTSAKRISTTGMTRLNGFICPHNSARIRGILVL